MLLTTKLEGVANMVVMGDLQILEFALYKEVLAKIDAESFFNKPVVIKGCGDLPVPDSAYVELTRLLKPYAKTLCMENHVQQCLYIKTCRPKKLIFSYL